MNLIMLLAALLVGWTTVATPVVRVQTPSEVTTVAQPVQQTAAIATPFSAQDALELQADSQSVYWHVETGGQQPAGALATFQVEDREYFYMGSDVDTKDKFVAYMQESYTKEAAEALLQKKLDSKFLVMHEGRLAKVNADRGSLAEWQRAKASLVQEKAAEKQFKFYVPIGEDYDCQTYIIAFDYVEGQGWRINSDPEALSVGTCPIPGSIKLGLDNIHKNAAVGLSYERVQALMGRQFAAVNSSKDDAAMWRYDVTERDDYKFRTETDEIDLKGIKENTIDMQLFVKWSTDWKAQSFSVYYKASDGKIYNDYLQADGTWKTTAVE